MSEIPLGNNLNTESGLMGGVGVYLSGQVGLFNEGFRSMTHIYERYRNQRSLLDNKKRGSLNIDQLENGHFEKRSKVKEQSLAGMDSATKCLSGSTKFLRKEQEKAMADRDQFLSFFVFFFNSRILCDLSLQLCQISGASIVGCVQ